MQRVRHTFSRDNRITCKREFDEVFAQGEKVVGRQFVGYWIRRCGQGSKLGLVVSRKVGKAVVRNRVKRHIREFFRRERAHFAVDLHLVVVARPSSAQMNGTESAAALRQLLQQGGVLDG
ncbi:MAG: ribonuclease P protein component [Candidatus Hydrogenedentes bacterium]|nr:ribonuclease P protein component [Candidatus Hydrogenedentota bacterium]MBI3117824.1 ribonuclease P protein component [Candidatus Hydrogenedentota bacterium]